MYSTFSYIAFSLASDALVQWYKSKQYFCILQNQTRSRRKVHNSILLPGFLIVAACVMTFEARDSAAKVVPATATNHVEDPANPQKVITFVFLLIWPL